MDFSGTFIIRIRFELALISHLLRLCQAFHISDQVCCPVSGQILTYQEAYTSNFKKIKRLFLRRYFIMVLHIRKGYFRGRNWKSGKQEVD